MAGMPKAMTRTLSPVAEILRLLLTFHSFASSGYRNLPGRKAERRDALIVGA
jgi:hypothetical protein